MHRGTATFEEWLLAGCGDGSSFLFSSLLPTTVVFTMVTRFTDTLLFIRNLFIFSFLRCVSSFNESIVSCANEVVVVTDRESSCKLICLLYDVV